MSAALIPAQLVPIARTDADWAFDIDFQGEDWTGSTVKVAFARQGLPVEAFEIDTVTPSADMACAIRLPADTLTTKEPGTYTVEVRRFEADAIDDAAVFRLMLYRGTSVDGAVAPPAGDGTATGGVIVSRISSVTVVRSGGVMGPPGTGDAAQTAFNDALTMLGVDNVQDAIVALYALIGSGPMPEPGEPGLLLETGDDLLLESGDRFLTETLSITSLLLTEDSSKLLLESGSLILLE